MKSETCKHHSSQGAWEWGFCCLTKLPKQTPCKGNFKKCVYSKSEYKRIEKQRGIDNDKQ